MRRGIGSVLPWPQPELGPDDPRSVWTAWTAGWPYVTTFRTARGALAALLRQRKVRRLWLPAYCCQALADAAASCGIAWYGVDTQLRPDVSHLATAVRAGDAVLGVDYFGAPAPEALRHLAAARQDVLWIEDRAQALDPGAEDWGQVLLYSPRKLIGVSEGGLLVSEHPLPAPRSDGPPAAQQAQRARAADPEGAAPEEWFSAFQRQEADFDASPLAMGDEARQLLARLAHAPRAARRRDNWNVLARQLPDLALWPGRVAEFAPLAFPVRLRHRDGVAAALAQRRIWCARHWPKVPSDPAQYPEAHQLAAELLSLPCDERYDASDMEEVAEAVLAFAR